MYHILAVDDESKALARFERLASKESRIASVVTFTNPELALEYCKTNKLDIAFLDIDMPKIQGLQLAVLLQEQNPFLDVIFVTAYEQYALEAFRVHAYDYLLKPIGSSDISELFDRFDLRNKHMSSNVPNKTLHVQCFGCFLCYINEDKTSRVRFRTAKTEELFALLLQYNGMSVSKEHLIDKLWPNVIPEKSANYFRVTCTYLRKALEEKGFFNIIQRDRDSYQLDTDQLDCDIYRFLNILKSSKSVPVDYAALETAANLYTSPYLEDRIYEWSAKYALWLENEYKHCQQVLAEKYIVHKQYDKACERLKMILLHDPFDEETIIKLITLLFQIGDTTSARIIYSKYKERLWNELSLIPSEKLQVLMN